jgi:hypothetical protein
MSSVDHIALARDAITAANKPATPRLREIHLGVAREAIRKARAKGADLTTVDDLDAALRAEEEHREPIE